MTQSRWITNLESVGSLVEAVTKAEQALKAAEQSKSDDSRVAQSILDVAQFKLADVKRAMAAIEIETQGRFSIGEPQATQWRTAEEIAAQGIIGIYRQGAGDGP